MRKKQNNTEELSDWLSGSLMGDDSGRDNCEWDRSLHLKKLCGCLNSLK